MGGFFFVNFELIFEIFFVNFEFIYEIFFCKFQGPLDKDKFKSGPSRCHGWILLVKIIAGRVPRGLYAIWEQFLWVCWPDHVGACRGTFSNFRIEII